MTCTFQNLKFGKLTVKAFDDFNRNRQHDNGEPWLDDWTIQLYRNQTTIAAKQTDDGRAVFSNLPPEVYTVCEVLKRGWVSTAPPMPNPAYGKPCQTVAVNPGQNTTVLFGNARQDWPGTRSEAASTALLAASIAANDSALEWPPVFNTRAVAPVLRALRP